MILERENNGKWQEIKINKGKKKWKGRSIWDRGRVEGGGCGSVFVWFLCINPYTQNTFPSNYLSHCNFSLSNPLSLSLSPFLFSVPNKWFLRLDLADISIVRKRFYDFLQCHVALPWPWVRHSRRVLVLALVFSSFLCYFIFNLFFFISLYSDLSVFQFFVQVLTL